MIGESDEEGEDEDDGIMADDAEEGEGEEEEFAAVGDFEPPDGWVVLPAKRTDLPPPKWAFCNMYNNF